ncbi:MAG: hypothetical protein OEY97_13620 [Nitrospirota bacterium]|nr:hypothetical protein [Nitrospirota bacterium]
MSEILEKAKGHFKERLAAGLGSIEVPEWGTTIHFRPLNLRERDRIHRFAAKDSLEALVETLIVRALDGDGKPLFKSVHRTEFMREVDPEIIGRVCEEMNRAERQSLEDISGN